MTMPPVSSQAVIRDVLLPGTPVRARGLAWEVVHAEPAGEQLRYRLRCTQGGLLGQEIDVLSPFERVEPEVTALDPKRAGPLQEWLLYHRAFLLEQALGPSALQAVQPGRLDIAPYQIVPVMRALSLSRPRLMLADGVGLGKTVEAGLIIAELIARRRAHRVLIVSPAGPLMTQWQDEMRQRFGLRFEALRDWSTLQEKRKEMVVGANPFDRIGLCLLSVDFGKQEKVMLDLERSSWDLVIIDEAHHCVRLGGASVDQEDSRRRRLAELLARQSDGLLLLTATPHDGYDEHFASLLELLDPSLVDGRGAIRGEGYRRHVVRRLKHHIKKPGTGEPMFKERQVLPRPVVFSQKTHPEFSALQSALLALVAPRLKQALKRRQFGDVLAFISLLKRSVSTVRACQNTLAVIADRYGELIEKGEEEDDDRKQRLRTLSDYRRRMERYGALSMEEEADQALLEAEDMAAHLKLEAPDNLGEKLQALTKGLQLEKRRASHKKKTLDATHRELQDLVLLAEEADSEDPKLAQVVAELREIRSKEPGANVLVYTEYTDSQRAVSEAIREAIQHKALDGEVLTIEGEDNETSRAVSIERFSTQDNLVLVSTDATAEGLNLHERCHHLIHVELPYNPNRLEQRNGRIDRYGQSHDPVVRYLYLAGTFEERVLLRLIAKYEKQRKRLTFVPNTLGLELGAGSDATGKLLHGLIQEEGSLFRREETTPQLFEPSANESDLATPAYQELLAEIDRAIGGFEKAAKTHAWLGSGGLNAEEQRLAEAGRAQAAGEKLGDHDLLSFVTDAVQVEARSATAVRELEKDVLALNLPQAWRPLDDVPGWSPATGTLLVTTNARCLRTASGDSVGYLGRAHPVVRRALDRVRNIPLTAKSALDRRVSAVSGPETAMVFTFLCTARSELGRELERVIAVQVTPKGEPKVMIDPHEWLGVAQRDRQVPTRDLWEREFAQWSGATEDRCRAVAATAFGQIFEQFSAGLTQEIAAEKKELQAWLHERTEALCGERARQLGFDLQLGLDIDKRKQLDLKRTDLAAWRTAKDPIERLASLKADSSQRPDVRQEADGVLQLFTKRIALLDRRSHLEAKLPATIGLLLVTPKGAN